MFPLKDFVSTVLRIRGTPKILAALAKPTTLLMSDCLSMLVTPTAFVADGQ